MVYILKELQRLKKFHLSLFLSFSMSRDPYPSLSRSPSYLEIPRKRAIASFENLVALANYEERLRDARKIVWRDRGERPVELQTIQQCLEYATKGAFSKFIFQYFFLALY